MKVRLTRRLANRLNGVDLSRRRIGDLMDLPQDAAEMLVEAGWATLAASTGDTAVERNVRTDAADALTRRRRKPHVTKNKDA